MREKRVSLPARFICSLLKKNITRQLKKEYYFLVLKTIFYSLAALIRKMLFSPLQNTIHIFVPPCNISSIYIFRISYRYLYQYNIYDILSLYDIFPSKRWIQNFDILSKCLAEMEYPSQASCRLAKAMLKFYLY